MVHHAEREVDTSSGEQRHERRAEVSRGRREARVEDCPARERAERRRREMLERRLEGVEYEHVTQRAEEGACCECAAGVRGAGFGREAEAFGPCPADAAEVTAEVEHCCECVRVF